MKPLILVIEDDKAIAEYLIDLLNHSGFKAEAVHDGIEGLQRVKQKDFQLVLLDLNLPSMSGEALCERIKRLFPDLPIIIVTGKNGPMAAVKGLNLGADDYITKPFDSPELMARIRSRLRTQNTADTETLQIADLTLNTETLRAYRGSKEIALTPIEFKLLRYLMANRERILTREHIFNEVWPEAGNPHSRVADVYIGYLRKKIDHGYKKKLIHSSRGFGYILKE